MSEQISVIIADGHPLFRNRLRQVIEAGAGLRILGEAGSGDAALKLILQKIPDTAILDVDIPVKDAFNITKEVRRLNIATEIILLTIYTEESKFDAAMAAGIKGYVLREDVGDGITEAIRAVAGGNHYVSPSISKYLEHWNDRMKSFENRHRHLTGLTPAERRILKLISENRTSKEIAGLLHISPRTVENHRTNIAQKLGLRGSHSLLRFATEHRSKF